MSMSEYSPQSGDPHERINARLTQQRAEASKRVAEGASGQQATVLAIYDAAIAIVDALSAAVVKMNAGRAGRPQRPAHRPTLHPGSRRPSDYPRKNLT